MTTFKSGSLLSIKPIHDQFVFRFNGKIKEEAPYLLKKDVVYSLIILSSVRDLDDGYYDKVYFIIGAKAYLAYARTLMYHAVKQI